MRFRVIQAFHFSQYRVKALGVIADSVANAQPGDYVWTGLNSSTIPQHAIPLDASAVTAYAASRWAGISAWGGPTGASSIDA